MSNSMVHFEIPADDVARAKAFYEKTFGWKIKAFPMPAGHEYYGVVTRKPGESGIDGGLMSRKMPDQPFTNYVGVRSIDAMQPIIEANGGVIIMPKQEIGKDMGWTAAFKDPENNILGLYEMPAGMARKAAKAPAKSAPASKRAAPPKRAAKAARRAAPKSAKKAVVKKAPARKMAVKKGKKTNGRR